MEYVSGYREHRADPPLRVLIGNPYHGFVRFAFGLELRDIDCDFRLFRRQVLELIPFEQNDGSLSVELLKKLHDGGYRFAQVPVHHYPRVYRRSQYFTFRGCSAPAASCSVSGCGWSCENGACSLVEFAPLPSLRAH